MRRARRDRERLLDILEVIEKLRRHVEARAQLDDPVVAAAATRWFEVIGEAAANTSQDLRDAYPETAWRGAIDMRNRLIHGYYDINPDRVWETIERDVPVLDTQVRSILEELPDHE